MKCNIWRPSGDQRWQDERQFSIWRFFEQFVFVNNHLLCYWPTINNLISKICPKFQVISSHFFKVYDLLDEQWALRKNCAKWKNSNVKCDKMYRSQVCIQEFLYSLLSLDIQPELSENQLRLTILHPKKGVLNSSSNMTSNIQFFSDMSG